MMAKYWELRVFLQATVHKSISSRDHLTGKQITKVKNNILTNDASGAGYFNLEFEMKLFA